MPREITQISKGDTKDLPIEIWPDGLITFQAGSFRDDYLENGENTVLEIRTGVETLLHLSLRHKKLVLDSRKSDNEEWGSNREVIENFSLNRNRPTITIYHHGKEGFQILFDYQTVAFYHKSVNKTAIAKSVHYASSPPSAAGALDKIIDVTAYGNLQDFKLVN
ncbi:uncharacterized protein ASPGLDRAFT_56245 [Aspergillus glaucus CBS 516.65]|uniref:Galectin n=1 Tax=Aspergillus glaucus CBS 516.65 TaxID=1160497 RepID=A0A1L9VRW8_ASPGL|nr:hypothetical protein ASPGLDRAFT_56245 [Aspergillus glaucus CBS 516.65]OJJ86663.1 hypothetical protein ASPGLDRAFT_56245 [Aspergillus glaucus CBS 516.65]